MSKYLKFLCIGGLYFVQGLPAGLVAITLPVLLKEQHVTQSTIALIATVVALPWSIKLLWSPWIDQARQPRRILWLTMFGLLGMWAALAIHPFTYWVGNHPMLWVMAMFLMLANFIVASQDILTDGLTVRLLGEKERGFANSFQVIAYKFGMMTSGGMLLRYYDSLGWRNCLIALLGFVVLGYLPSLMVLTSRRLQSLYHPQHDAPHHAQRDAPTRDVMNDAERSGSRTPAPVPEFKSESPSSSHLIPIIKQYIKPKEIKVWLACLVIYKLPDGLFSGVLKSFALDYGLTKPQIGTASNWGLMAGIVCGILAGWVWKNHAQQRFRLLKFCAIGQLICALGFLYLSHQSGQFELWWVLSVIEPMVDTFSTVILFACMMHYARESFAGIDYTFQASLLVFAAGAMHLCSGKMVDVAGFSSVFALAVIFALITQMAVYVSSYVLKHHQHGTVE